MVNERVEELMREAALRAAGLPEELDAAQVADLLMLDRGFVAGLLDSGDIPGRVAGDAPPRGRTCWRGTGRAWPRGWKRWTSWRSKRR